MKNRLLLTVFLALFSICINAQTASSTGDTLPKNPPEVLEAPKVLMFADTMPEFPGGSSAFMKYLADSIHYPETEAKAKHEGTVWLSFIVETDGRITHVRTVKPVENAPGLSLEAERVLEAMPNWKPAMQNGKPVPVKMMMPVKFVLEKKKKKK